MEGWGQGLGPTSPVIRDGYLYGRGGADDGYSVFSAMLAIKNAQIQGVTMPRCVLVLESEEESGSPHLLHLLDLAKEFIQKPDFLLCLDTGALNYDTFWLSSSLRGMCALTVTVKGAKEGYHSGEVGGIVPETFRVLRTLLNRIEDPHTHKTVAEFDTEIPAYAYKEAEIMESSFGIKCKCVMPVVESANLLNHNDAKEMYLNNNWRPSLSIIGASGLPPVAKAGNVLRSSTSLRLSLRIPPNADPRHVMELVKKKLTENVPYNCKVEISGEGLGSGWCMKTPEEWVTDAIN
jgi:acetylornithine deacetylase/succinyl-diaminopimelate desuccinylase-like protein